MKSLVVAIALLVAGCAGDPPPAPDGLSRPVAWAMKKCQPLPDVPANDGDPAVRAPVDKAVRLMYVECAAKVDVHIRYVETVAPAKK